MQVAQRADAIDTRIVYWAYAALAGLAGFVLSAWGPLWLGSSLPGQPWAKAALIRVLGSFLMAAGCFAAALAAVDDPLSRRRGLLWFAAGHTVIFCMVSLQREAIWGPGPADWAAGLVFAPVVAFLYLWFTAEGDPPEPGVPFVSLFGGAARSSTERLRSLFEQHIRETASQEERNRLARDLHDSIKQQLFIIQTAAATTQARFDEDRAGAKQALDQVRSSAREAVTEMEVMLDQLRAAPLENIGLIEALKKQCEALGFRTGARVDFKLGKLPPSQTLAPGAHQAILRVAQEALANVGRHARARNVLVALDSGHAQVVLRIQDDGGGFDPNQSSRGMGIPNMCARAKEFGGNFELASRPGAGTSMSFSIPCTFSRPEEYRQKALQWGALLVLQILLTVYLQSMLIAGVALMAAIAFTRETVAYLRTRNPREAA